MAGLATYLDEGIFLIPGRRGGGCNVFVLKGRHRIALIDCGLATDHGMIGDALAEIGVAWSDIGLVLLTHEHVDHRGGASLLPPKAIIAAHGRAASAIGRHDDFMMMTTGGPPTDRPPHVDIHLDHGTVIDLGGIRLRTIATPGHCAGAVCFHDPDRGALFTGDTVLAGGVLGGIYSSGNLNDSITSLELLRSLRLAALYPGHGAMSDTPEQDMRRAVDNAHHLLSDTRNLFEAVNFKGGFGQLLRSTALYPRRATERRRADRVACAYDAVVVDAAGGRKACRVLDISPRGARLEGAQGGKDTVLTLLVDGSRFDARVVDQSAAATRLEFVDKASEALGQLLADAGAA